MAEYLPADVAQIEDVGSPVDGQHDGAYTDDGQHYLGEQQVEPGLCDGLLQILVTIAVEIEVADEASDGEDACQLHDPPDEYLHRQQRVAHPRTDECEDEDGHRDVGVEHVGARNVPVVLANDEPLPNGAKQQNGGEGHVDQLVGDEHDAEGDDDEAYHDQWRIDVEGAAYLVAVDTQEQRDEDDTQEPSILDEQAAGHDEEVLLQRCPHDA